MSTRGLGKRPAKDSPRDDSSAGLCFARASVRFQFQFACSRVQLKAARKPIPPFTPVGGPQTNTWRPNKRLVLISLTSPIHLAVRSPGQMVSVGGGAARADSSAHYMHNQIWLRNMSGRKSKLLVCMNDDDDGGAKDDSAGEQVQERMSSDEEQGSLVWLSVCRPATDLYLKRDPKAAYTTMTHRRRRRRTSGWLPCLRVNGIAVARPFVCARCAGGDSTAQSAAALEAAAAAVAAAHAQRNTHNNNAADSDADFQLDPVVEMKQPAGLFSHSAHSAHPARAERNKMANLVCK